MSRTILCLSFVTSLHCHRPRDSQVQTHFYTRVLFSYAMLFFLSLFSSSFGCRATECWIKRKKPGITALVSRISRNKSTSLLLSFFFFNSFEHLLLVISCFLLCTLLVDNSSMLGQQQKGDDAEKRISRGATRSNYKFVSREYCFLEGMGVLEGREVSMKWKRFLPSFSPFSRVVLYSRDKWFRVEDTIIMLNDITQRQRLRYSPCNRPRRPRRWMRSTATGSKGPRFRTYTSSGNKFNVCQ